MNFIRVNDAGKIEWDNEVWLNDEFSYFRKDKSLTSSIFMYLYWTHHPKMQREYEHLNKGEKKAIILKKSGLEYDELVKPRFKKAEEKFISLCQTIEAKALDSCIDVVHTLIETNSKVNTLLQRYILNDEGTLEDVLEKTKLVIANITKLDSLLGVLSNLKNKYEKQLMSNSNVRGDQEEGWNDLLNV